MGGSQRKGSEEGPWELQLSTTGLQEVLFSQWGKQLGKNMGTALDIAIGHLPECRLSKN